MTAPAARYFTAFKSFILRDKHLLEREQGFLERKDDLVALQEGQERGWLDGIIESRMEAALPETVVHLRSSLFARVISLDDYIELICYDIAVHSTAVCKKESSASLISN